MSYRSNESALVIITAYYSSQMMLLEVCLLVNFPLPLYFRSLSRLLSIRHFVQCVDQCLHTESQDSLLSVLGIKDFARVGEMREFTNEIEVQLPEAESYS